MILSNVVQKYFYVPVVIYRNVRATPLNLMFDTGCYEEIRANAPFTKEIKVPKVP